MTAVIALNSDRKLVFAGLNMDDEAEKENRKDAAKLFKQGYDISVIPAENLSNYEWAI